MWRRLPHAAAVAAFLVTLILVAAASGVFSSFSEPEMDSASTSIEGPESGEMPANHEPKYSHMTAMMGSPRPAQLVDYIQPQAIISLSGALGDNGWYTTNVEVSLYATGEDSDSLTAEYALYNQGWVTFTEPFTIFEEGQTAIYYRVRDDTSGFVGETRFTTVDLDKTPPTGSVFINEDAADTLTNVVALTLYVVDEASGPTTPPPSGYIWGVPSGPADIRFSNTGLFWSPWEPVTSSKSWILETGAGNKTIYVQARDNAGLVSETFTDIINLITTGDSTPPVTEIATSGKKDTSGVYTSTVAIALTAIDNLSGLDFTEYSFDALTWTTYSVPFTVSAEGKICIYYRSCDLAGNVESTNFYTLTIERAEDSDSSILRSAIYVALGSAAIGIPIALFVRRKQQRARNE
jgi:hypothetical protein